MLIYDLVRESKDCVYGIWVYKVLGIWKGYYRAKKSLVSCMEPWTEAWNYNRCMKPHSKLTYQLSFSNVSRKVDYHAGGKWFIHGPKRHKENQLLSPISYVFFQHTEIVPWLTVMMRYYVTSACSLIVESHNLNHGPLAKYVKLRVRMRRECRERFPRQITSPYSFHIFQWIWWLCILFHMNIIVGF